MVLEPITPVNAIIVVLFVFLLLALLITFWGYTIHYCRKVVKRLGYRTDIALAVAFFAPIPALVLYTYYSFTKGS
jgi:hypothetical protein